MEEKNLANEIAKLSVTHYNQLPKTGKPNPKQWTIMSTIVEQNKFKNTLKVVSLGTGSKCIGQNKLCPNGSIINDSHAEVICRRAFIRYLYQQIDQLYSNNAKSIFTMNKNTSSNQLQLNPDVNFHLFCTQVPCGDAAIFPKQYDNEFAGECLNSNYQVHNSNNKRILDINRTGAKCLKTEEKQDIHGEGTKYHVTGVIRTKPGRGDPTTSKSCSDKLARWIRVGIQGALLTLFIEPIYLQSIILAENVNYSNEAFERALFSRFCDTETPLKLPFKLNVPKIVQSNITFPHQKQSSLDLCSSSIIWCDINECKLEIAVNGFKQGVTKKQLGSTKSQLCICKKRLFENFITLIDKNSLWKLFNDSSLISRNDICKLTYLDVKNKCTDYNLNWEIVKNKIFKVWTTKDNNIWMKFNFLL